MSKSFLIYASIIFVMLISGGIMSIKWLEKPVETVMPTILPVVATPESLQTGTPEAVPNTPEPTSQVVPAPTLAPLPTPFATKPSVNVRGGEDD